MLLSWKEVAFGRPGMLQEEIWIFGLRNHPRFLSRQPSRSMLCSCVFHPVFHAQQAGAIRSSSREQGAAGGPQGPLLLRAWPQGPLLSLRS